MGSRTTRDTADSLPWAAMFAGLCASMIGIGIARFAYTPLIPPLIEAGWFPAESVVYLGAANLAGYLAGALVARQAYCGIAGGFDGFLQAVLDLRAGLDVPHTLEGLKVDSARFEEMSQMAIVDPTAGGNPVELTLEAARDLYQRALEGRV